MTCIETVSILRNAGRKQVEVERSALHVHEECVRNPVEPFIRMQQPQ